MAPDYWRTPAGRRLAATIVTVAVAGAACGDDGDDKATPTTTAGAKTTSTAARDAAGRPALVDPSEFVGTVDGKPDLFVAVSTANIDGRELALVYLCDGQSVAEYLQSAFLVDGDRTLFANRKGSVITAARDGRTVTGTGKLADGTSVAFTATEVDPEGTAGFWLADSKDEPSFEEGDWGGWIVLEDGSQRGALLLSGTVVSGGTLNISTGAVTTSSGALSSKTTGYSYRYSPF